MAPKEVGGRYRIAQPGISIVAILCYGLNPFARAAGGWAARAGKGRKIGPLTRIERSEKTSTAAMKSIP
jgi:hypothetical protein